MKLWAVQAAIVGLLVLADTVYSGPDGDYVNVAEMDFTFDCDPGHALTGLMSSTTALSSPSGKRSVSMSLKVDRLWNFTCSPVKSKAKEYCEQVGVVSSSFDKLIAFLCPSNTYIAGVRSSFDRDGTNGQADRTWGFKCCRTLGVCTRKCELSEQLNNINTDMDYITPDDHIVTGFHGTFYEGDRVFRVEQCKTAQCGNSKHLKYIFPLSHY